MLITDDKLRSILDTIQIDDEHTLASVNTLQSAQIKDQKIKLELM